jgi:acyl-coenzyme A thioesterase PaaI-like protein
LIAHHPRCFACGRANPFGLGLELSARDDGSVSGRFRVKEDHQGPPGYAHGGILSTALDEAMALLVHHAGIHALTTGLEIRLRAPVPVDTYVEVTAHIEGRDGRRIEMLAAATGGDPDKPVATARGTFVEVRAKQAE